MDEKLSPFTQKSTLAASPLIKTIFEFPEPDTSDESTWIADAELLDFTNKK